jgi:hypothetical protein
MPKMDEGALRAQLEAQKADALASTRSSKLTTDRAAALNYYMGDVSEDIPDIDGRSRAVSTDVSDTVEGLMPVLMEIFAASDEVVEFAPVGPEDVQAAKQETDYVNHVFMQKNPGFMVLYSFIKDALLSKMGIVKIWTEENTRQERETFYDQPDDSFALLAGDKDLDIIAHSVRDTPYGPLHDVTVERTKSFKCHRVMAVPPEEFGVSREARDIKTCNYCFHEVRRTQADLIADGYDADQVKALPEYSWTGTNQEALARDTVDENQAGQGAGELNRSSRMVIITEHHVRMDYMGDGKTALYRVTTGGQQGEILYKDGELQVIEENRIPMAVMSPIVVTHRLIGRSVADLVMDIQRIKTALMRSLLDNTYMSVNPRPEVAETFATEQTLDDLLTMRPGQPIRTKQPGGITWQKVPFVGADILPVIQFMDTTREWRTGVSRQSQGVDPNALQNQVATIANQMQSAADQKVKLIARIFAETGVRDMFALLHAEIRENGDQQQIVRLRNQWVPIDPQDWRERDDMTINVGLGTGSKQEELAKLQLIIGAQTQAIQVGLVSRQNLYNSARELVRLSGRKDCESYFVDPSAPPAQNPAEAPIPPPENPQVAQAAQQNQATMAANQQKAALEQQKAQADAQRETAQAQSEIAIANQKFELEKQLKLLDAQIAAQRHQMDLEMANHKMALQAQAAQAKQAQAAATEQHNGQAVDMKAIGDHLTNLLNAHTQTITTALHSTAKRIRKHPDGSFTTEMLVQ